MLGTHREIEGGRDEADVLVPFHPLIYLREELAEQTTLSRHNTIEFVISDPEVLLLPSPLSSISPLILRPPVS